MFQITHSHLFDISCIRIGDTKTVDSLTAPLIDAIARNPWEFRLQECPDVRIAFIESHSIEIAIAYKICQNSETVELIQPLYMPQRLAA